MSLISSSPTGRRSFLKGAATAMAVPAAATIAGGVLADTAHAAGTATTSLPDFAPIPASAFGPTPNASGYAVGQISGDLHWVTDGFYQAMFLTTPRGVVLVDAPPTIGRNLQRATRAAIASVDPTPYFAKYGPQGNAWAIFKTYLAAVADTAAAPVVAKYTGVLAAADVYTPDNAWTLLESLRIDSGVLGPFAIHP